MSTLRKDSSSWRDSSAIFAEEATANAAAKALGLTGVKPIGKWKYQTGGYTHWVVEALPAETMLLLY